MGQLYKYGSQGRYVKDIQQKLNDHYGGNKLKVDGIYGNQTQDLVEQFQKDNGLTVDGIVGDETLGALSGKSSTSNNNKASPKFEHKPFEYDKYTESETVTGAKGELDAHSKNEPGEYMSKYMEQIDALYDQIVNRDKFTYDVNGDALYQQYKDKYIQQGKMAMQDTMGQATAMTGGYGNSYAATAGNQAYQASLENLNDIVPELQQMAYERYLQEGEDMYNQYGMLLDRESTDYDRYMDSVNKFYTERDYLTGRYDTERGYDYDKYLNDLDMAYKTHSDDQSYGYQQYRDQISDDQWQQAFDFQKQQYEDSKAVDTVVGGGNNTTGGQNVKDDVGYTYNNGGLSTSQIAELQKAIGASPDGKWGPKSQKAAGGLTAAQAWDAYQRGELSNAGSGFTGKTYEEAVDYMTSKGVPNGTASGIMTASEWNRRKSSYQVHGQGGTEVVNYDSYSDYLADFVEYALETYGK